MGKIRCLPFACTLVTKPLPSSLLMRRQASLLLMSSFRCDDVDHDTGTLGILDKNQASGGALERPNVASGSLVSSMAFCFAFDDGPLTWPHAREACPACPETPFTPLCPAWMNPCRLLRARANSIARSHCFHCSVCHERRRSRHRVSLF